MNLRDKERVYNQLQGTVSKVPATQILISVGDWNSLVDFAACVLSDAHASVAIAPKVKESRNLP